MSVVQTVESRRTSRGAASGGRLFVLDLSGGHVFSINPDGSGKKILVSDCRVAGWHRGGYRSRSHLLDQHGQSQN